MHRSPCSSAVSVVERHVAAGSATELTLLAAESAYLGTSRYQSMMRIATGGMGAVYLGFRRGAEGPNQFVAIKRLHAHLTRDPFFQHMLRAEAACGLSVCHPNVVRVVDFESVDGELALVMEYVEGATVAQVASSGRRMPVPVALRIALDLCAGLDAIHQASTPGGQALGIVHRDISPQNAIVDVHGVARIADFGVALTAGDDDSGVLTKGVFGKSGYIAPECLVSGRATPASDVFALGVVIWEMLAGERLFNSEYRQETPSLGAAVSVLDPILARALAVDATERCTAAQLLQAIESAGIAIATPASVAAFVDRAASSPIAPRAAAGGATVERTAQPARTLAASTVASSLPVFSSVAEALSTSTSTVIPRCQPRSLSPLAMIQHIPPAPELTPLPFDVDRPNKVRVATARTPKMSKPRETSRFAARYAKVLGLGAFAVIVVSATLSAARMAEPTPSTTSTTSTTNALEIGNPR